MIETAWLSAFSGNVAALGLAAGAYLVYRLVRRLRCASHTKCCDIESSRWRGRPSGRPACRS